MTKISGGCQCGGVRYETNAEPVFAAHCQCSDCKKSSGAGHATAAGFPEAAVSFTGKAKAYSNKTDSGATATREFCPECGGRLTFRSSGMPGLVLLLAGSMDDPEKIKPTGAIYGKRHLAWDYLDPSLNIAEAMPPQGDANSPAGRPAGLFCYSSRAGKPGARRSVCRASSSNLAICVDCAAPP